MNFRAFLTFLALSCEWRWRRRRGGVGGEEEEGKEGKEGKVGKDGKRKRGGGKIEQEEDKE